MFGLGIWELLIILAIILVVFGPKRLKNIGSDLGSAIKGFRTAIKDEEPEVPVTPEKVIEGEANSAKSEAPASTKSDPNV
jgi:sec-independent protein translocase protein TatA